MKVNANKTEMNQSVEGMDVVFIDDVLYTGRSIRSALTAIDTYGRPNCIELLVLIDRRFSRHLPIQPDYLGAQVDALQGDKVRVIWSENSAKNIVMKNCSVQTHFIKKCFLFIIHFFKIFVQNYVILSFPA